MRPVLSVARRLRKSGFRAISEIMERQEIIARLRENEAALRARGAVRLASPWRCASRQRYRVSLARSLAIVAT
jgi:hypothetical protein